MKAAIDAGKIGRPVLGVFIMYSWRDEAYYRSDPWRGRWDTEGGGVLVNQSPHQLDLLQWFMGPIEEISGYWANLNHPDHRGGRHGRGRDPLQERRPRRDRHERVAEARHLHQGPHPRLQRRVGRRADRPRRDVHRRHVRHRRAAVQRRLDHPRRGARCWPSSRRRTASASGRSTPTTHYHALQIRIFCKRCWRGAQPLVTGDDGRVVVEMFTAIYRSNRERRAVRMEELGERPAGVTAAAGWWRLEGWARHLPRCNW